MRLWILSDLHMRAVSARTGAIFGDAIPDADVAVIAGDLTEGLDDAMVWLARTITTRMPTIFCLGNHEFYGEYLEEVRRRARAWADRTSGLHLLDDSAATVAGVRFLGCTLWTDYRIFAHGDRAAQRWSMRTAEQRVSDHRQILMEPGAPGRIARNFTPTDALALHEASVAWLDAALAEPFAGPTVVVSHHAPHPNSVAPRWMEDATTPAFVSDLSSLIDRRQPELWVHGHTHASFDYMLDPLDGPPTKVICNPRGYGDGENTAFDWSLVVEV